MKNKKKIVIISIILVFIIVIGVLAGIYVNKHKKNNEETFKTSSEKEKTNDLGTLSEVEKEIIGIDTTDNDNTEEKEKTYSDLYKEYLKLPQEEKEKSEVIPRKEEVPFEKLEEIKDILEEDITTEDKEDKEDKNKIPERFNLAEKIDIKVENQYYYELCWGFASIKTLETYLALNNLGNYNFSELHLDYIESELMYGDRVIHEPGNFSNFQNYIIESGVVLEEQVPYAYESSEIIDGEEYTYTSLYEYTEEQYSKFVDMEKVVEVTETVDFPSIYKDEDSKYTEEQLAEFRETVKKHIMKNGGLYTLIVGTGEKNYYADVDTSEWANHAVTIVGWDDNYSKDNFLSSDGKKPSKDGAYIALNSWGTENNDGGYYYISYEDKYVESDLSGIISTSIDNAYKIDSIKNEAIKEYLINGYSQVFIQYEGEDYITKNVISNIKNLDLSNSNITSIEGIEIFENATTINLSNNKITNIEPLTKLNSLTSIDLSNNNITDISPFSNIKTKSLATIKLANNKIKDVSVLSNIQNESALYLDISNNQNVVGVEQINNISTLDISGCNITDLSKLQGCEKLVSLKVANTPGIKEIQNLPENLNELDISNCNIDEIPVLKNNIYSLNISKNNITTLEGVQNYKNLNYIDISENPIKDWTSLKVFSKENLNPNEYGEGDVTKIVANNCSIEDITIFNGINIPVMLELKDNNIENVSELRNKNIYSINLSNNKNLKGLEGLSNIQTVFLNNCNISDINEVLKLEKVIYLSLENNNLTDISDISKLKNISNISLAGNKELRGTIKSETLYSLNVSDCNLKDDFELSKIPNLSNLNISKNKDINDVPKMTKNLQSEYITLILDELNFEEWEEIKQQKENINIEVVTLILNYNLENNDDKIDLSQNKVLKRELMKIMSKGPIDIKNGFLNKNGYIINIDDLSKNSVEIKLEGWYTSFPNSTMKIIFNQNDKQVTNNNLVENNITNDINIENNIANDISTENNAANHISTENNISNEQNNINSDESDNVNINTQDIVNDTKKELTNENTGKTE